MSRALRVVWNRRRDVFTRHFYDMVKRVMQERFNFWQGVSHQVFLENLRVIEARPWNLLVELTNICNADCIFCAYRFQSREQKVMSREIYLKALNDYCAMGGGDLMLAVSVGDPAVDPDFIERIREARARPEIASIETITNAIALKPVQIEALLRSGLSRLQISTAPMERNLFEKIYRSKSYDIVKRNIRLLLEKNQELGCPVEIKLAFRGNLSMRETLSLPDYSEISRLPHRVEFNADFDTWTGEIRPGDLLPGMQLRPLSKLEREPCYWFYDGPIVFVDGSLGLCGCRDFNADSELVVGNIMDDSLLDIWQGAAVKDLRERFRSGDFPAICRKCTTYANLDMYRRKPGAERAALTRMRLESKIKGSHV
ncbi:MAG TPA: radical SAM/SPASM domain-containing protein [Gallionella sp.]|nr:radical SAM/SPASM domain-containing protein [Gallionella sp.]